jgi:hypothetical protein
MVIILIIIVIMFVGYCQSTDHSWQNSGSRITNSSLNGPFLLMGCLISGVTVIWGSVAVKQSLSQILYIVLRH